MKETMYPWIRDAAANYQHQQQHQNNGNLQIQHQQIGNNGFGLNGFQNGISDLLVLDYAAHNKVR